MRDFLCDLHMHSCLSPCGDSDMTPYNLVNMAKVMGLDMLALTDHNSSLNCPAAEKAAKEAGIGFIPGMELTTSEEVHIVCLFPETAAALEFSELVSRRMPKIQNRLDLFGEQLVMDDRDGVIAQVENLLGTASFISIDEVSALVGGFGGICYPAHIDRPSFSVISNLGFFDPDWNFACAEISANADVDRLISEHGILAGMRLVRASDAHFLENVGSGYSTFSLTECSPNAVIGALGKK